MNFAIIKQSIDCNPLRGKKQSIRLYVGMFVITSPICLKIMKSASKLANALEPIVILYYLD